MLRVLLSFLVIEVWRIPYNICDSNQAFQFVDFQKVFRSNEIFFFLCTKVHNKLMYFFLKLQKPKGEGKFFMQPFPGKTLSIKEFYC